ncbi:MAG TPA: pantoate--beta-alanine ligase [Acidimicrobiales bacterium]|nr:pantoate--beta-alanine ligase [Acidimicrobiales bacterium]
MTVEVIEQAQAWRDRLDTCRSKGQQVGLVPTMGALHGGHMSLIRRAAGECDVVAVTDYVNPLQFGPAEDLAAYPRDLERDCLLAAEAGADFVFAPSPEELWPDPGATTVRVDGLTGPMEGRSRPGHFDGVTTIVAKLFSLTGPCWAYFGEKDFQQLAVVRRMAADLSLPVAVVGCPTVRDPDGLALSSRNAYLSDEERAVAPQLYYALLAAKRAIEEDELTDPARAVQIMSGCLAAHPRFTLDYAEVADPRDLTRPARISGEVRLFMAARLGRARLIDNVAATPPDRSDS